MKAIGQDESEIMFRPFAIGLQFYTAAEVEAFVALFQHCATVEFCGVMRP